MLATLVFDVEDLITTQSDDAAKWIAAEVERAGIVANLFLVGEKVRLMRERGREDVIEHLKAHEFGFHSTTHSVHPVICEVCAPLSFLDGAQTLIERERDGWEETEAILGARLFRRHLLLLLMGFFALGNFASAMAPRRTFGGGPAGGPWRAFYLLIFQ